MKVGRTKGRKEGSIVGGREKGGREEEWQERRE